MAVQREAANRSGSISHALANPGTVIALLVLDDPQAFVVLGQTAVATIWDTLLGSAAACGMV